MNKHGTPWTQEDIDTLTEHVQSKGYTEDLCRILGRTKSSIYGKADSLGIESALNVWTEEQIDILRREYPQRGGDKYLRDVLKRGRVSIGSKAMSLGLKRMFWTPEQIALVKRYYPIEGMSERLVRLVGKTRGTIYDYANKHLKLKARNPGRPWTEEELSILREGYEVDGLTKELQRKLNRTKEAIRKQAQSSGLKPPPRQKIPGYEEVCGAWLTALKRNAKIRDIDFNLEAKYIWDLFVAQNRRCKLSGLDIALVNKRYSPDQTASLDRVDSTKGYVQGNVQWVHRDINFMKHNRSDADFIRLCVIVTKHQQI